MVSSGSSLSGVVILCSSVPGWEGGGGRLDENGWRPMIRKSVGWHIESQLPHGRFKVDRWIAMKQGYMPGCLAVDDGEMVALMSD